MSLPFIDVSHQNQNLTNGSDARSQIPDQVQMRKTGKFHFWKLF